MCSSGQGGSEKRKRRFAEASVAVLEVSHKAAARNAGIEESAVEDDLDE